MLEFVVASAGTGSRFEAFAVTQGDAKFLEVVGGEAAGEFDCGDVVVTEDLVVFFQIMGSESGVEFRVGGHS